MAIRSKDLEKHLNSNDFHQLQSVLQSGDGFNDSTVNLLWTQDLENALRKTLANLVFIA